MKAVKWLDEHFEEAIIIFIGFALGVVRSIQMCIIHIKNLNVSPVNSVEAAAADELNAADIDITAPETEVEKAAIGEAIDTAWTDNGKGDA